MIKKEYGKEYSLEEREQFLKNTCDGMEEISYSRAFTPEELAKQREVLTEASIALADIEVAKKEAMAGFKEQAKPYEERLYKDYRVGATKRGKCFELSFDEFVSIMEKDCFYCGLKPQLHPYEIQYMQKKTEPWKHNGIDRIDSSRGYTIDNCVPCCSKCNYAKHEMTIGEFKEYITSVYNKLVLEGSTTIPKGSTSQAIGGGNGVHPNKDEDIV